jgi:hypothetical protein
MIALSGCQTRTSKLPTIVLPEMPLIPQNAVDEVKQVCVPSQKCDNLNNWLNELYAFDTKYSIYKQELKF